ncbi:hypothetical protein [Abyssalbus ytuae]|uniref:Uncharacterized protein n=1 Tax=Abyssalbus ytuae TaxID=2926907 RepID=A0A9E7CU02_9FLAO|nr:hypothetical protein [Abyssalbus ytuae]UOB17262.1 hypothetical protein MQE35_16190 [Abyssalbus ytuae]
MKIRLLSIIILFVSITLFNSIKTGLIFGYYILNTPGFIERYCENKDKPELKCNGKCQLAKMINQNSEKDKNPIDFKFLQREITLYFKDIKEERLFAFIKIKKQTYLYAENYQFIFVNKPTHPPQKLFS